LTAGRSVAIQTLIDGTFTFRTSSSKGYVIAINAAFNSELLGDYISQRLGVPLETAREMAQPVKAELRYMYNQEVKSVWSIATVLMMLVLMITPPFLTALGVVREKGKRLHLQHLRLDRNAQRVSHR